MHIRPLDTATDLPAVAALISLERGSTITPDQLADALRNFPADGLQQRLVAVDPADRPVGFGRVVRAPWDAPGRAKQQVIVLPEHRRQGAGSALQAKGERFAASHDMTRLVSDVNDTDAESLAFAQSRGYVIDRHYYNSFLDPIAFDETPFAAVLEAVFASGIRFFSFADPHSEADERKVYDLYCLTAPDIPGNDSPGMEPFAEWRKAVLEHKACRPDCLIVAADGDRFVGVTHMAYTEDETGMFTWYTAVDPAYRGRHIALALKLLSVRTARRYGVRRLGTSNDSLNGPMLAINRKMGYVREPGGYALVKQL